MLLDECLPVRLRHALSGHDVATVTFMGWSGTRNGQLLSLAAQAGFDVFVTTDQNLERQQNLKTLPLAVLVLDTKSNDINELMPLMPHVLQALCSLRPQSLKRIGEKA